MSIPTKLPRIEVRKENIPGNFYSKISYVQKHMVLHNVSHGTQEKFAEYALVAGKDHIDQTIRDWVTVL